MLLEDQVFTKETILILTVSRMMADGPSPSLCTTRFAADRPVTYARSCEQRHGISAMSIGLARTLYKSYIIYIYGV
jgi:hypothetical protein